MVSILIRCDPCEFISRQYILDNSRFGQFFFLEDLDSFFFLEDLDGFFSLENTFEQLEGNKEMISRKHKRHNSLYHNLYICMYILERISYGDIGSRLVLRAY